MKFIDFAKIKVKAGRGGKGCSSFRREKYVPRGGPDGGDGGKGGDIVFRATNDLNTLLDFRYKREYFAENGQNGMGKKKHGKDGKDLIIPVPVGTTIKLQESDFMLADLVFDKSFCLVAQGGRGGLGNAHFANAIRQAPKYSQPGEDGEEKLLILELKLLADVGLVGMPNAGKSTFISYISASKPKIGDYPFTTLVPNLGVVRHKNISFVVADIPGLIEGSCEGAGLGLEFLRHVERTKILLHLIDISDNSSGSSKERFEIISREILGYSQAIKNIPVIVVGTKLDAIIDYEQNELLREHCKVSNLPYFAISSHTGSGVSDLLDYVYSLLNT